MNFDPHGHALITPRELQAALGNPKRLINSALIPGTPAIFPDYVLYGDFLECLSDCLRIHPCNFVVRGSSKLGFSIKPTRERVWGVCRPDSDLDLAIVDPDYFHVIDREVRHLEQDVNYFRRHRRQVSECQKYRKFYYYRYHDLPETTAVIDQRDKLKDVPVETFCGQARRLTAFIFRDWWSVFGRWEAELRKLQRGLANNELPHGGHKPRTADK